MAAVVAAAADGTRQCENCSSWVPASNFDAHCAFCARNKCRCDACGELLRRADLTQHTEICVARADEGSFDEGSCEAEAEFVRCEFCALEIGCADIVSHAEYCGSRTERCATCRRYIRLNAVPPPLTPPPPALAPGPQHTLMSLPHSAHNFCRPPPLSAGTAYGWRQLRGGGAGLR